MQDNRYGEFDNFDDFFNDILSDLEDTSPAPRTTREESLEAAPAREPKRVPSNAEPVREPRRTPSEAEPVREPRRAPREAEPVRESRRAPREAEPVREPRRAPREAEPVKSRRKSTGSSALFMTVLFAVTAVAWALPLRPTESVAEKRNLETFPEFSATELFNGEYFKSIESWFADTFTFRDSWMSVSDSFKKSYGINTVAIYGDAPVADAIPIPAPVVHEDSVSVPEGSESSSYSSSEAEPVEDPSVEEEQPALPEEAVTEEDDGEWGGLTIVDDDLIADKGGKLMIGDSVFLYPGFNEHYARQYAEIMNTAADILEGKANFYSIIVPQNVSSMLTREDREKYGFVIEEDALDFMYSLMDSNVGKVNILKNLQKHNDEYIVFRTDHHWTAVGAYYAYEEWCKYAGKTPVPLSDYQEIVWEKFYGTYFYTSGEPRNLREHPDDVHAFVPPGDVHLYLDFNNKDQLGEEYDLLLDRSVRQVDQYITFLTSDQAKATLINNSIDDDSACLVLKTSFGNPFVYYLTQHYHTVYVIDMRYYGYRGIVSFCDEFNVSDVIMIHATDLCYTDRTLSVVKSLIR